MSQVRKLIERPKVRFCSTTESIGTNSDKFGETSYAPNLIVRQNKPQIKSIVTIKQPIRLISKETAVPCSSGTNIENRSVSSESILKSKLTNDSVPCYYEPDIKFTCGTKQGAASSQKTACTTVNADHSPRSASAACSSDIPSTANSHALYPSGIQKGAENYHTTGTSHTEHATADYNAACSSNPVNKATNFVIASSSNNENKVMNHDQLCLSYPMNVTGNNNTAYSSNLENDSGKRTANYQRDVQDTGANCNFPPDVYNARMNYNPTDHSVILDKQNRFAKFNVHTTNFTSEEVTSKTMADSLNTRDINEVITHGNSMKIPQSMKKEKNNNSTNHMIPNARNLGAIPKSIVPTKISTKANKIPSASGSITGRITSRKKTCTIGTIPKKHSTGVIPKKQPEATLAETAAVPRNAVSERTVRSVLRSSPAKLKISAKVAPRSCRSLPSGKTVPRGTKSTKTGGKMISTMKKTVVRDVVSRPMINAYIGPGVTRYKPGRFNTQMEEEKPHIRPDIVSGGDLRRPEYNSIMCTINKLQEVQEQKFVTDVDHLPTFYKNFVNGKVSAALDFSPDEAIFKNLVDLSISENQLPSRLTRSKDPEPRQRDIVPKLSYFFTPSYSEEYCCAVQVRPPSPENVDTWSAFAISDKIFGWKHDMDHCH